MDENNERSERLTLRHKIDTSLMVNWITETGERLDAIERRLGMIDGLSPVVDNDGPASGAGG
jgi:hypothetical protein